MALYSLTKLEEGKILRSALFVDPRVDKMYSEADQLRRNQTKHDKAHGLEVAKMAGQIAREVEKHRPGLTTDWEREVIIPIAALLHDVGGEADNHDVRGAEMAHNLLNDFSIDGLKLGKEDIRRICRIIALHRSSKVLKSNLDDAAWAIVVIADKCVGDEQRVRPWRQVALGILTFFRLSWIPLRKGGVHDRANFAIKSADLTCDKQELVLKLTVDLRVCEPKLIYELYNSRLKSCRKAAKFLGFDFRLEFNGKRFRFDETAETWIPVPSFKVC